MRIFGEFYDNRARVEVLQGFSGHGDRDDLLDWVGAMNQKPKRTFLVHGEEQSAFALADSMKERYQLDVAVPEWKQSFTL